MADWLAILILLPLNFSGFLEYYWFYQITFNIPTIITVLMFVSIQYIDLHMIDV